MSQTHGNYTLASNTVVIRGSTDDSGLDIAKQVEAACDVKDLLQAILGNSNTNIDLIKGSIGEVGSTARGGFTTLELTRLDPSGGIVDFLFCAKPARITFNAQGFQMTYHPEGYIIRLVTLLSTLGLITGFSLLIVSFTALPENELIGITLVTSLLLIFGSLTALAFFAFHANQAANRAALGVSTYLRELGRSNMPASITNPAFGGEE